MYDIQLFGPLQVRTRGVRLTGRDFGGVRPRHILALLALHGTMRKAELVEMLWDGRPPANHLTTMDSYVSLLRHRLDPSATATSWWPLPPGVPPTAPWAH
jgi:DNA-binding SARP family transcriptional activator